MTRLAASQYAIELIETWEAYAAHLSAIVREAKENGAELLLLPEYSAMTLTGQLPPAARSDLHRSIEEIQPLIPSWVELCEELARQHQILFQPGSAPVQHRLDHPLLADEAFGLQFVQGALQFTGLLLVRSQLLLQFGPRVLAAGQQPQRTALE